MKLLNLGMDAPLTLGMAHPLAERVEILNHSKASKPLSRSLTAALIMGGALMSAPLTLASDKTPYEPQTPQSEELAGGSEQAKPQRVFKFKSHVDNDGEHSGFEVQHENGEVLAYRIGKDGVKTQIDPSEISEGQLKVLGGLEAFESLQELEGMKIILGDVQSIDVLGPEKIADILAKVETNLENLNVNGTFNFDLDDSFEFDGDNAQYVERLEALNGDELTEVIKGKVKFIVKGANETRLESLLEAATSMVESAQNTSNSAENASRDLSRVERELAKALKALEKAEKALEQELADNK